MPTEQCQFMVPWSLLECCIIDKVKATYNHALRAILFLLTFWDWSSDCICWHWLVCFLSVYVELFTQIYVFYIIYYSRLYVVSSRRTPRLPREASLWPGEGQLSGLLEERHHRIPPQVPRLAHHYQRYHRSPLEVIDYTGVLKCSLF